MPKVTVVARLTVKPGAVAVVEAELRQLVPLTRAEAGCLEYRLHRDNDAPEVFLFYENWTDAAALERHLTSAHFQNYVAAVGDLLVEKVVQRLSEIA